MRAITLAMNKNIEKDIFPLYAELCFIQVYLVQKIYFFFPPDLTLIDTDILCVEDFSFQTFIRLST